MSILAVIILGNKLQSSHIHPELKGRMDVGIKIFIENLSTYLILSGGKSNPHIEYAECEIMRGYAIENGIQPEKIILDHDALDTIGNAYFTRKIIDRLKSNSVIYIVSSCYHMSRVKFIFEMCYRNHCSLNFDYCYHHKVIDIENEEKKSIKLAKKFFLNVKPGDIKEIERRLFAFHELYKLGE